MSTQSLQTSQHHSQSTENNASLVRRAGKACSTCHTRKIRCDVLKVGLPCTKCKANNFACSIVPRKKRRSKVDAENVGGVDTSTTTPRSTFTEHVIRHQVPHYTFLRNFAPIGRPSLCSEDVKNGLILPITPRDQSTDLSKDGSKAFTEDMGFLKEKGAFDLPRKAILDECISAYFRVFHPFFPILDRPVFLAEYWHGDTSTQQCRRKPSLLLLQAIIFTASAFIPMQRIHEMGFSTRRQARSHFHSKLRLLHQFEYESSDIVTIQALLLMSHYYPSMAEQRHTWFWVHQAIGLAQGAGLHRDSGNTPQRKLWTRIWWACLVRDRLIALGTSRPMHINSLECNVPFLTVADLEEEGDNGDDRTIKTMFVDFTKLCHYMEGVLSLPFAAQDSLKSQITVCESTLRSWYMKFGAVSRSKGKEAVRPCEDSISLLYRTLLNLIYNVVLTTLLQSSNNMVKDRLPRLPSTEVQSIAANSTSLLEELKSLDLIRYLPTTSVTAVLPPLIIQVLLMRSSEHAHDYAQARNRFEICMEVLEQLGHIYWHASFYHDFFQLAAPSGVGGLSSAQRTPMASMPQRALKTTRTIDLNKAATPPKQELSACGSTLGRGYRSQGHNICLGPVPQYDFASNNDTTILDGSRGELVPLVPTETRQTSSSGQLDLEKVVWMDVDGQNHSFHDWLDDSILFQSLFPSA